MMQLQEHARRIRHRFDKLDWVQFGIRGALLVPRMKLVRRSSSHSMGAAVVLSVMRNAEPWLSQFLDHHRQLGIHDFVVIDNGSTDRTTALLRGQEDVTLLQTQVPYSAYENTMKRFLARRFGRGRWCLFVDSDELFDWPLRKDRPLGALTSYLEDTGATAVMCQMLDMFRPEGMKSWPAAEPRQMCTHCDLTDVAPGSYRSSPGSELLDPSLKMHWGGIRARLFGTSNGLTKISLFKAEPPLKPFHMWHHARNARIADVTCVLYHYPFTPDFAEKAREAALTGRYGYVTSNEYRAYAAALVQGDPDFHTPGAMRTAGTDALLENGFLVAPPRYRQQFG